METDPDFHNEEKPPPAKPSGLDLIVIIILLLFVAWGTYEFAVRLVKDGSKPPQETEQFP